MAWNEPGGSGGKDPWGNRGDQGPPDLDEVVRKLQGKLGGMFGGGRGGRGGGSRGFGSFGIIAVLLVALVVWVLSGIYIVDEGKRGVVLQFGAFHDVTMPGPHWYPRFIQSVEKVDVSRVHSIELGYRADEALMLTQDENIIDIKFAVQYQVSDPGNYLFNVRDPDTTLRDATESAVREVVGKSKMDFVITGGRAEIVQRAQQLTQDILDRYETGLIVTNLNMQDAQAPEEVQAAFADAVKAREDEERLKNEAEAYANDVLPKARGAAARVLEESQAYKAQVIAEAEGETARFLQVLTEYTKAPSVTRKRLYIDSLESVLSQASKVIVDTENGNNLLYLPLDKLMQKGQQITSDGTGSSVSTASGSQSSNNSQQSPTPRLRDNLRRREVR